MSWTRAKDSQGGVTEMFEAIRDFNSQVKVQLLAIEKTEGFPK